MCLSSQTNAHIRREGGMSSVFFVLLPTQHDACCISWDHQDFNDLNYISLSFSSLCTVYIFVLQPFSFLILLFGHYSYIPLFLAIINLNINGLSEKKKTNNYHLVGQVLFFSSATWQGSPTRKKQTRRKKRKLVSWMFSHLPLSIFLKQQTQRKKCLGLWAQFRLLPQHFSYNPLLPTV